MFAGDERAHLDAVVESRADLELLELALQRIDQRIGRVAHRNGHRDRHAALAGRAIGRADQRARRILGVGVGHHDHVVLRAAQRLHALAVRRGRAIDVFGDRRRADEADGADARIREQRVHGFAIAVDDVEHAVRQAGLLAAAAPRASGSSDPSRTASARTCCRRRSPPGTSTSAPSPGKLNGVMPAQTPTGWRCDQLSTLVPTFSLNSPFSICGMPQANSTTSVPRMTSPRASENTLPCSTVISRASSSSVLLEQRLEPEHDPRALQRRRGRPGRQRSLGRGDGRTGLVGAGIGHFAPDLAGGRVVHGPLATGGSGDFAPADEMAEFEGLGGSGYGSSGRFRGGHREDSSRGPGRAEPALDTKPGPPCQPRRQRAPCPVRSGRAEGCGIVPVRDPPAAVAGCASTGTFEVPTT